MKIETAISQVLTESNNYEDEHFHSHVELIGEVELARRNLYDAIQNGDRVKRRKAMKQLCATSLVGMRDLT